MALNNMEGDLSRHEEWHCSYAVYTIILGHYQGSCCSVRFYVIRQMVSVVPVIIAVTLFVFLLTHAAPGDPAVLLAPEGATKEDVEVLRHKLALDRPLPIQYLSFLERLLHGDMGDSYRYNEPVVERLKGAVPATYELTVLAAIFATVLAVPVGVICALRKGTYLDNAVASVALFGVSMPHFWFGLLLILLLGVRFPLFPIAGRISYGVPFRAVTGFYALDSLISGNWTAFKDVVGHLVLPAVTLASGPAAGWSRLVRSAMLEAIDADYVRTARAKGLSGVTVVWKHAFRNALLPVVTMAGIQLRQMLGGSIVVETVFGYPGLGRLLITGIQYRDYFLVMGVTTVFTITAVALNTIVDLSYAFVDPRIHYS